MSRPNVLRGAPFLGEQAALAEADINRVFQVLLGYYGNLFLAKYSTGMTDEKGEDQGFLNTRRIWAQALRPFDGETVKAALLACQTRHLEYPPSLPQFIALCAASRPREVYQAPEQRIEMDPAARRRHAREARAAIETPVKRTATPSGQPLTEQGLGPLTQAIADAVAAGGGDEAAALVRLENWLTPRKSTANGPHWSL